MITSTERAQHTAYMAELINAADKAQDREQVLHLRLQTFADMLAEDGSDGTSTGALLDLHRATQAALRAAERVTADARADVHYASDAWAEVERMSVEVDAWDAEAEHDDYMARVQADGERRAAIDCE